MEIVGEGGMGTLLGDSSDCRGDGSTGVVIMAGGGLGDEGRSFKGFMDLCPCSFLVVILK